MRRSPTSRARMRAGLGAVGSTRPVYGSGEAWGAGDASMVQRELRSAYSSG